jgi:hypothetical protein
MSTKYTDGPLELDLPERWGATRLRNMVILHDKAEGGDLALMREGITVRRLAHATNESLEQRAKEEMRRHVRQGHPEHRVDALGSLDAEVYEWTDGTMRLISWFVQPTRDDYFRLDYATRDPEVTDARLRERAADVLGKIEWNVDMVRSPSGS